MRVRRWLAPLGIIVALGLLAGCGDQSTGNGYVTNVQTHDGDGMSGIVLPRPYHVPAVTLRDTEGAPYDLRTDTTKPLTLVFFGYTNCPDICQVVMAQIASAVTRLDPADRHRVQVLFVTTDPARDTRDVLRRYLDRLNPAFDGLTGSMSAITRAGAALGVEIQKGQKLPGGGYDVTHGTDVIGVEPGGTAPIVWTQSTTTAQLAADLHRILHGGIPTHNTSGSGS